MPMRVENSCQALPGCQRIGLNRFISSVPMHRFKPDASVINDALESVRWIGASMNRCIGIDKWIAIPHRSISGITISMQMLLSIWLPYLFPYAPLNVSVPDSDETCDFRAGGGGSGAEGGGDNSLDGIFTFAPLSNEPKTSSSSSLFPPKKSLESKWLLPPKFPNWTSMSRKSGNSEVLRNGDEGGEGGLLGGRVVYWYEFF